MVDMDLDKLKLLFKVYNVENNLDDDELKTLINIKLKELDSLMFTDIIGKNYSEANYDFKGNSIVLDHYPVKSIESLKLNDKDCEFKGVENNYGIIHLSKPMKGVIEVTYNTGYDDEDYNTIIEPLLMDMVAYTLKYLGDKGNISSVSEGDVSISYDTTNNLGNTINNRINRLSSLYSIRCSYF